MRFRNLGDSDVQVSTISLGSWLTYSGGVERDATEACTRAAFEAGVTFFDTANVYGAGASETAWGEILKDYPRDSYILATKVFFPMSDADRGLSAAQIAKQIDASLQRLQTDHVDLYQCHRFDPTVPIEETMEALSEVVRSGKARAIGFSEWNPEQIRAGLAVESAVKFVSSQPQYSALWRGPEAEVFPVCSENGISQVVWSPLAEGVLTGKYQPGEPPPPDSRAASDSMSTFIKRRLDDRALDAVQELLPIADGLGLSPAQLALAWVLRRPEVASAIVGASRPEQVFDNAKASDIDLDDDTIAAMDAVLAPVAIIDPQPAPGFQPGVLHR
ncbi:1-deoxyxylulose-5-phosphate synthase YajO [Baekduia alba]|uniref:aldo/keto reductase family protein n=1 Tax=Baekduia alba TaxID=2997333 RepID=UPI0023405B28|nr:aldo/keto reductase family protein [Baekduia alba]WCB93081.1 1-deoxyxylulose-5-phosphate synthase YajO [Baekduia alba]